MKKIPFFIALNIITFSISSWGQTIYKGIDTAGNTSYSDKPLENGQQMEIQTYPSFSSSAPKTVSQIPTTQDTTRPQQNEINEYKVSILEPLNEQTFTTDIQTITVKLSITPRLRSNDKIRLYLNDQPSQQWYGTSEIPLEHLPRGSYTLKAEIASQNNPTLTRGTSQTVTFFQRRTTIQ